MQTSYKNYNLTFSEEVVFTRVLLGGYALTQVRMIHILLTSDSQVHHVSIVVVVVALEWLSGVTTMSQHAHKKRNKSSWQPGLPMAPSGRSKSDGKLENCLTRQSQMHTLIPGVCRSSVYYRSLSCCLRLELTQRTSKHLNLNKQHFSVTKS